jgi:Antibiotic biosynthesis monooxygenase
MRSSAPTDRLPDVPRPDAAVVLVGEWAVPAGEQQRTIDAVADQWSRVAWPEGLLSHTVLAGLDHATVLHYSQAGDEHALRAFAGTKSDWVAGIDASVGPIGRRGVAAFRLYRSVVTSELGPVPGCVVVVRFRADGGDQARAWVDRLVEAGNQQSPPPGLLSAHFHIALDGTGIVNYAEWTDPAAHQATLGPRPTDNAVVRVVDATPGVQFVGFRRFTRWRTVTADTPTR